MMSSRCRHKLLTCRVWVDCSIYTNPSQGGPAPSPSEADDEMDISEEDHADSPRAAGPSLPVDQGVAALGQEQQADEDDGDNFRAGTDSNEEDDEATLEEEEVRPPPCTRASCSILQH